MLDDHEHLPDAVVDVPDQRAHRGPPGPERELAGGRGLEAHLVLKVRDLDPVPLAQVAVGVDQVLGHQEHGQALGAGGVPLGAGQHQVEDVLGHVVLGAGDEPLDALDVPGAVGLADRLGAARSHIGAGVRLGQHHGRGPPALDRLLGEPLLLRRAQPPQEVRENGAAGVHPDRRVGAQDQFRHRPAERPGSAVAAELGRELEPEPLGVHERLVGPLEAFRQAHRARGRVEYRRVAVGLGERLRQRAGRQPVHLAEDPPRGLLVDIGIGLPAQHVLAAQHLEEVELDITQVALVVTHGSSASPGHPPPGPATIFLLSGNKPYATRW